MPEIQMPPQYMGSYYDPQDTEGHVRQTIERETKDRLQIWSTAVLLAVEEFKSAAMVHIDELEYSNDATYSFHPVLGSFATAVMSAFPPTAMATSILSGFMDGLHAEYDKELESGLSGAKVRLKGSVAALARSALTTMKAVPHIHSGVAAAVEEAMTWVDSASTDPEYVSAFCDWMGFVVPTDENTGNPVRQSLENPFFGVYQAVRAQLLLAAGVPGLGPNELNSAAWEHDAVKSQRERYNEDGPDAWDKVYKEIQ